MDAEKYGLINVDGKMRYFSECRFLRSDAKKGDTELTLVDGKKVRVFAETVQRWPDLEK